MEGKQGVCILPYYGKYWVSEMKQFFLNWTGHEEPEKFLRYVVIGKELLFRKINLAIVQNGWERRETFITKTDSHK